MGGNFLSCRRETRPLVGINKGLSCNNGSSQPYGWFSGGFACHRPLDNGEYPLAVGWSDLLKKKIGTRQVVRNCFRTPISKFPILMLLFNLALGLRKYLLLP